jgi:hypothetical protein
LKPVFRKPLKWSGVPLAVELENIILASLEKLKKVTENQVSVVGSPDGVLPPDLPDESWVSPRMEPAL